MFEFLTDADIYLKTFWYVAMPVSLIFVLQAILTISGMGHHTDFDHDTDNADGSIDGIMQYFTLRNLINFLLGFSWGGIGFYNTIDNKVLLVMAALGTGIIFVALFFYIIQQVRKLEENNSFDIKSAIGKDADVYLHIPSKGAGNGKVQISIKGAIHELDAVSAAGDLPTGSKVLVLDVLPDQTLLVHHR
jgi:hypothetical protein